MILLLLFAFLAGIVTVLSPCIFPMLPIILAGSVGGEGKSRPLGIVTGFVLSFTFFTLFLSLIVQATGVSADALRVFSIAVIGFFGVSLIFPPAQKVIERAFSFFSRFAPTTQRNGYFGGVLLGASLGLLWTPCVGPILAAVISLAISGTVSGSAFLITFAYALGTAGPLLAITYGGQEALNRTPWLAKNTRTIQQVFGVIMILTAFAIWQQWDRKFQTWFLQAFPQYGVGLTKFEDTPLIREQLLRFQEGPVNEEMGQPSFELQNRPIAPEIEGGANWLNSEPLTLAELRGKVVLIDFWTYSCINCIRTFPYLKDWHDQYADSGLVIIGVHAPEFEFEKNAKNVARALEDFSIEYPVVQDNNFAIWRAYNNRYWPAKYLIDKEGRIRYTHFGEGEYQETENAIRALLGEMPLETSPERARPRVYQTPEIYLGYQRASNYLPENDIVIDQVKLYTMPTIFPEDSVGLSGGWRVEPEFIEASSQISQLKLKFTAAQVYLVLAPPEGKSTKVRVLLNGEPLVKDQLTADMNEDGYIAVTEPKKYDLLNLDNSQQGELTLEMTLGTQAYAFTFGQAEKETQQLQ